MKREQILETIRSLAMSQGFYGRLYNNLMSNPEHCDEVMTFLEAQNFKDPVDLILCIEG